MKSEVYDYDSSDAPILAPSNGHPNFVSQSFFMRNFSSFTSNRLYSSLITITRMIIYSMRVTEKDVTFVGIDKKGYVHSVDET